MTTKKASVPPPSGVGRKWEVGTSVNSGKDSIRVSGLQDDRDGNITVTTTTEHKQCAVTIPLEDWNQLVRRVMLVR